MCWWCVLMKNENLDFNKSIVKYFMDFLETDFHKRTIPKRKIVYTNSANMLVGCNLKKYDKIEEKLKKMLNGKMDSTILSIKKNEYVSTIKSSSLAKLNDLVRNSCEKRVKDVNKNFIIDIDKKIKSKKFSDIVIINDAMPDLLNQIELLIIDKFIEENFGYLCNIGVLEQDIITIKASILNMFESCIKDKLTESFEDFRNGKEESIKD